MTLRLLCLVLLVCVFVAFGKNTPLIEPRHSDEHPPTKAVVIKDKTKTDVDHAGASPTSVLPNLTKVAEKDENSLAEALRVIQRRKREISRVHRPYSSFKPLGAHRYRYPLYKKRATYYAPDYYDYSNSFGTQEDYDNFLEELEKPSMFRERERGPTQKLISNAHFSSKPTYYKRKTQNLPSEYMPANNLRFNLDNAPYDLNVMGKLYELGKRAENSPTKARHLDDLLFEANKGDVNFGRTQYLTKDNARDKIYSDLLNNAGDDFVNKEAGLQNSVMRRQKRASAPAVIPSSRPSDNNNSRPDNKSKANTFQKNDDSSKTDRQKRAYDDSSIFLTPEEEEENDFLTREYFKTIARSVGNKKKRMAYAKFEAQKRSNALDAFLENPQMLHYVQQQIREAEEEVAKDAENEIQKNSYRVNQNPQDDVATQILLTNSIARLDALERMRESLHQLERLQEQDVIRKRSQRVFSGFSNEEEKEKRRKALRERLVREGQKEEEEERQKRITEESMRKKKQREEEDEEENRRKRKEAALRTLIKGNRKDDCPVLERIVINCIAVTEMVSDEDMIFLEPCLRHEVCYMCGSGLDVSRHECDALLSSALEAGCNDIEAPPGRSETSLECLSAAGETYNLLSDPNRYDDKGTCTFDPCVRQLIDSR